MIKAAFSFASPLNIASCTKLALTALLSLSLTSCVFQVGEHSRSSHLINRVDDNAQRLKGEYGTHYNYNGNRTITFPDGFTIVLSQSRRVFNDQKESPFTPLMIDGVYHDFIVYNTALNFTKNLYLTPSNASQASFAYNGKIYFLTKSVTSNTDFVCTIRQ